MWHPICLKQEFWYVTHCLCNHTNNFILSTQHCFGSLQFWPINYTFEPLSICLALYLFIDQHCSTDNCSLDNWSTQQLVWWSTGDTVKINLMHSIHYYSLLCALLNVYWNYYYLKQMFWVYITIPVIIKLVQNNHKCETNIPKTPITLNVDQLCIGQFLCELIVH